MDILILNSESLFHYKFCIAKKYSFASKTAISDEELILKNSDLNLIIGTGAQINMLIQADKMEADVEINVAQTSSF